MTSQQFTVLVVFVTAVVINITVVVVLVTNFVITVVIVVLEEIFNAKSNCKFYKVFLSFFLNNLLQFNEITIVINRQ